MKIFVNAGHGGEDPGAISKNGLNERDVNRAISGILYGKLKNAGFEVHLFQETKGVNDVIKAENAAHIDLFVSIHCNKYTTATANGVETLYLEKSVKGQKFAQYVQNALVKATELTNRGIKPRNDLGVLKYTLAPAILIECAFLSNLKEEAMLKNEPGLFANAIFEGIKKYCAELGFVALAAPAPTQNKTYKVENLGGGKSNLYVDDVLKHPNQKNETVINFFRENLL